MVNEHLRVKTFEEVFKHVDLAEYAESVRAVSGDRTGWTLIDLLREEIIPIEIRATELCFFYWIDDSILNEFACRWAEYLLSRVDRVDPRSIAVIDVKRRWSRYEEGLGEGDLMQALDDAQDAVIDVAEDITVWDESCEAAKSVVFASVPDWHCAVESVLKSVLATANDVKERDDLCQKIVDMFIELLECEEDDGSGESSVAGIMVD